MEPINRQAGKSRRLITPENSFFKSKGPELDLEYATSGSNPGNLSRNKCSMHSIQSPQSVATVVDDMDKCVIISSENSNSVKSSTRIDRNLLIASRYVNEACDLFEAKALDRCFTILLRAQKIIDGSLNHVDDLSIDSNSIGNSKHTDASKFENTYIYQRAEFDEGMNTYCTPLTCSVKDEQMLRSTILFNIGQVYFHQEAWENAIGSFDAIDPRDLLDNENITTIYIAALQSCGQVYYRLGKFKDAIYKYRKALKVATNCFGKEGDISIASAMNSMGVLYYHLSSANSGKKKAEYLSEKYLKISKECTSRSLSLRLSLQRQDHKDIGTTLNNMGRLYVMEGSFEKALECYDRALIIRAKELGKQSLDYAATAFNAGQSYHHVKELSKAMKYYKEFLEVAKKHFTKNHRDVAVVLSGIAEIHQDRGELDEALKLYKESLEVGKKALGDSHPEIAMILNRLGNYYYVVKDFDAAYDAYKQGLAIECQVFDDSNSIVSLCNLGEIHRQRKNWDAAIKTFRQVLRIQRKMAGKQVGSAEMAATLQIIGMTYDKKGETQKSLKYLQEALVMKRNFLGDEHIDVTPTMTAIATILARSNKLKLAMNLFKDAYQIRKKQLGYLHRDVAFTLYHIALIHQKTGSLTEAISCLTEVLSIEQRVLGKFHKDVAITLYKLGDTFKKHNDLDRALFYFKEALDVERKVMMTVEPLTIARTLQEIGNIHLCRGNTAAMMDAFVEAARIYQESSVSPYDLIVAKHLYALDLSCPRGAPAA